MNMTLKIVIFFLKVGDRCCEWICLKDIHPHGGSNFDATNPHGGGGGPASAADVKLRLVASAVTAILSVALLFFLVYRLRKRKLANREERRRRHDDEMSVDSIVTDHHPGGGPGAYPMTVLHPPHSSSSNSSHPPRHSYWHSWAWWKPSSNDMLEARPAPPSYDEAMMNASQQQQQQQQQPVENCECSSIESNGSEAPPYSEIHLDPIISEPSEWYRQQQMLQQQQQRPPAVPCGAALVLPVPPQPFPHLNHVGTPPPRVRQEDEITPHLARPRSQQSGQVGGGAADLTPRRDITATLPHVIRRMRARSREGIVLPPEERDAVLQRFSLQLNLNISSSGSSSSSTLNTLSPERSHRQTGGRPDAAGGGGISPSSASSVEHY